MKLIPWKRSALPLILALLLGASLCGAQNAAEMNRRLDLYLEKKDGKTALAVSPSFIFAAGDQIRFRLKPAVSGYLYVMNQGSSGTWQQLFPRNELTQSRRVLPGKDYIVPSSVDGWFRVTGPAGYDNVYFLISPLDLGKTLPGWPQTIDPAMAKAPDPAAFSTATPRCDDEMFKARGECLDSGAGLKPIQKDEKLPDKLSQVPDATSRDLIVVDGPKETAVSSTQPFDAPAIFRFRIAHK